jgi:hypothetical protein
VSYQLHRISKKQLSISQNINYLSYMVPLVRSRTQTMEFFFFIWYLFTTFMNGSVLCYANNKMPLDGINI